MLTNQPMFKAIASMIMMIMVTTTTSIWKHPIHEMSTEDNIAPVGSFSFFPLRAYTRPAIHNGGNIQSPTILNTIAFLVCVPYFSILFLLIEFNDACSASSLALTGL